MHLLSYTFILFFLLISTPRINAQHKDCNTAFELCDNSPLYILPGGGIGSPDPDIGTTCVSQEFNSMWVKWTVMKDGIIAFVLSPDSLYQDLDFVVFQSGSDYDCNNKTQIRCMAAGANSGQHPHEWINCTGLTGLAPGNTDVEEPPGCPSGNNNFLAPIQALAGEQYIMLINEFSGSGYGYTLNFTGTAVLNCITGTAYPEMVKPQVSFAVYPTVSTGIIFIHITDGGLPDNHLSVFNAEGQMVYTNEHLSGTTFQIDLHHLSPGSYFAVLRTSNSTQTQQFLITK
ncbi:MAG TPA: T9SS type A sorting domain-containing protein [Saprospiraceae bacterium]|nr:T9SS type A sorting domain-containing protein [Saprospiraceae bacterium]